MKINLSYTNETSFTEADEYCELLKLVCEMVLLNENACESLEAEIGLVVVSGETIRGLNKKYRSIDQETDVLSFPMLDFANGEELASGYLGDIVISYERAAAQAEEYGHSLRRELCFLTAHSMLHLLGYDHESAEDEAEMAAKQDAVLDELKIQR